MARLSFWPYLAFFAFMYAAAVITVDPDDRLWITVLDAILAVVSIAGMLIYRLSRDRGRYSSAWKPVFVFLAAGVLLSEGIGVVDYAREPGHGLLEVMLLVIFAILLELPNFVMNGRLAFVPPAAAPRPLRPR